jgi:hypothetical protein
MHAINRRRALTVVAALPAAATFTAVPALADAHHNPYEALGGAPDVT